MANGSAKPAFGRRYEARAWMSVGPVANGTSTVTAGARPA
jgi:hypothetical protein